MCTKNAVLNFATYSYYGKISIIKKKALPVLIGLSSNQILDYQWHASPAELVMHGYNWLALKLAP